MEMETDMLTIYHKTPDGQIARHTMDVTAYYCEWRRAWVAYDANLEPDSDGDWPFYGEGSTRAEAIKNLIEAWEERQ